MFLKLSLHTKFDLILYVIPRFCRPVQHDDVAWNSLTIRHNIDNVNDYDFSFNYQFNLKAKI